MVGTFKLEVSPSAIAPTAANVAVVTLTLPAAVVFKTFSFAALPSATASANLITCEYDPVIPALQNVSEVSQNILASPDAFSTINPPSTSEALPSFNPIYASTYVDTSTDALS